MGTDVHLSFRWRSGESYDVSWPRFPSPAYTDLLVGSFGPSAGGYSVGLHLVYAHQTGRRLFRAAMMVYSRFLSAPSMDQLTSHRNPERAPLSTKSPELMD
jgi:hypothetical protein